MSFIGNINIWIVLAWIILTIVTLFQLKNRALPDMIEVLWVIVICCFPILGRWPFSSSNLSGKDLLTFR